MNTEHAGVPKLTLNSSEYKS